MANYPYVDFDVVNLGISTVNSITLRYIVDDVLNQEADLILFYSGYNVYYGSFTSHH